MLTRHLQRKTWLLKYGFDPWFTEACGPAFLFTEAPAAPTESVWPSLVPDTAWALAVYTRRHSVILGFTVFEGGVCLHTHIHACMPSYMRACPHTCVLALLHEPMWVETRGHCWLSPRSLSTLGETGSLIEPRSCQLHQAGQPARVHVVCFLRTAHHPIQLCIWISGHWTRSSCFCSKYTNKETVSPNCFPGLSYYYFNTYLYFPLFSPVSVIYLLL